MRKLIVILLAIGLLLLAAACSDDSGDDSSPTSAPTDAATDAPTEDPAETAEPTEDESGGDSASSGDLFGSFNPFSALEGLGSGPTSAQVDPSLKAPLLTAQDLPGHMSLGEFSFSSPNPDGGTIDVAASMFMAGDIASGEIGSMVMSMAAALPAGASDELKLDELADLSPEELQAIASSAGQYGAVFSDISVLDASGLGESGGALHMEMDFEALLGGLGAPPGENPFEEGIAMDMYMFVRGDRMLMLMLMYPANGQSSLDGHALAEVMDGRAS